MELKKTAVITAIVIFYPTVVWASGGGPLLLLFNSSVFIIGQIWILGVEYLIYRRFLNESKQKVFSDVLTVNIYSMLIVALGVPLIIAIIGLAGSLLKGNIGVFFSLMGTWVYEGSKYTQLTIFITFFWYIFIFAATVYFEAWIYQRRWKKRAFNPGVNPVTLSWYANTVSHIGLLIAVLIIWHEIIWC